MKTFGDMPQETLEALIALLERKYPPPSIRSAILPEKLAEMNFAMGQRSVVEDLLAEKKMRESKK